MRYEWILPERFRLIVVFEEARVLTFEVDCSSGIGGVKRAEVGDGFRGVDFGRIFGR